jgi:hypothetical protein
MTATNSVERQHRPGRGPPAAARSWCPGPARTWRRWMISFITRVAHQLRLEEQPLAGSTFWAHMKTQLIFTGLPQTLGQL